MLTLAMALAFASDPQVTLSGIVVARSGRHAATLASAGRLRSVVAGDGAFGCNVAAIRIDAIDLVCGVERRTLKIAAPVVTGPVTTLAAVAEEPRATEVTMNRAELQERLDREMSRLMSETTLIPTTSRGQVTGFTLSRVPAGTILETIGLKAGDVLVSVNDTAIDSFTTLIGLWPRLQTSGAVRAQIMRDGKPMDLSVSIK